MDMKKGFGLLLSVLLLAACGKGPTAATVPADEAVAIASSAGTDLDWTWSTVATVPAREAVVEYQQEAELEVLAEAVIEPTHWSALGFKTGGEVAEVLVEEGDTVQAGDVLVRLDPTALQLAVRQAEAGLEIALAQLALVQAPQRPEKVAAAEAQLESTQAALEQASAQWDQLMAGATEAEIAAAEAQVASATRDQKLAQDAHADMLKCIRYTVRWGKLKWTRRYCPTLGMYEEQARFRVYAADEGLAAAQAQLDQVQAGADANQIRAAQASVQSAAAQRDQVEAQLDQVKAGAIPEEIAVAQAGVAEARAAVEAAQVLLAQTEVRAPFSGTVTTVNVEVGNIVGPGQVACVLAELNQFQARTTDLPELDIAQVVEGRPATVIVDALEGQKFEGVARQIALQAEDFRGQVVYAVIVELTNAVDAPLRWGMTAWVEFETP
jgi:HlyD family secretion protein